MASPLNVLTVVGARPQFVKAAVVSKAFVEADRAAGGGLILEDLVHTGQHYDAAMSQVFFDELGIPPPAVNLEVGSGSQGETTARMLEGIERELLTRRPDWVLVYGDTNSTLAGALAAAKLRIPVAHVEAGLRSFNRAMPEEVNRVLTDHVSTLLLVPTAQGIANLAREGITAGVRRVGDVMYDAALAYRERARAESKVLRREGLSEGGFVLATVHRAENTDDPARLAGILAGLARVAEATPVVLPVHPRTRKVIAAKGLEGGLGRIRLLEPLPYLDMVALEVAARVIVTDSGGVQKEAFFHGVPCVTVRDETEWVETVESGWNVLVGCDTGRIAAAVAEARPGRPMAEYGTGRAGTEVVAALLGAAGARV